MGNLDTTFGALAAATERAALHAQDTEYFRTTLADVCTERDDYRAKLNRAELRNDSLRAQIEQFAPPKQDRDTGRIELAWSYLDDVTVVVDGDFERHSGGMWDVQIDAVYLRGADITGLITADKHRSLCWAVEVALEKQFQDSREELAA